MDESIIMDSVAQTKRMNNLLNEILDLSRQLAAEVDRDDQMTIHMILSMRGEVIENLKAAETTLRDEVAAASPEDAARLNALLKGEEGLDAKEMMLSNQIASNRRILANVVELDRVISRKLARERSIYQKD